MSSRTAHVGVARRSGRAILPCASAFRHGLPPQMMWNEAWMRCCVSRRSRVSRYHRLHSRRVLPRHNDAGCLAWGSDSRHRLASRFPYPFLIPLVKTYDLRQLTLLEHNAKLFPLADSWLREPIIWATLASTEPLLIARRQPLAILSSTLRAGV